MIIRILFNGDDVDMCFGGSYKSWNEQLTEYIRTYHKNEAIGIWESPAKWISMGGLKWCHTKDLPQILEKRENRRWTSIQFQSASEKIRREVKRLFDLSKG